MTGQEYDLIKRRRWSKAERERIAAKYAHRCAYCGKPLTARFALDHVIPLRFGGIDNESNLVASCIQCNHRKGVLSVEAFRKAIEDTPRQLVRKSLNGRLAEAYGMLAPRKVKFYFEQTTEG